LMISGGSNASTAVSFCLPGHESHGQV